MFKNWEWDAWRANGFCLGIHWQLGWNGGDEKRIYILWWEINIRRIQ